MKTKQQEQNIDDAEWDDVAFDHVFKHPTRNGDYSLCGSFQWIEGKMRYPDQAIVNPLCPICEALRGTI